MADFSYFDQFFDIQIDLTQYLKSLSVSGYPYRFNEKQPVVVSVKNLFTHYNVVTEFKKNTDTIIYYTIEDGDSVDMVSYKLYETTDYWWIIYVFNNIKNPWLEWPFTQEQLNEAANLLFNEEGKYSYEAYYRFLQQSNETKQKIIVPQKYAIRDFIWAYRQQILGL